MSCWLASQRSARGTAAAASTVWLLVIMSLNRRPLHRLGTETIITGFSFRDGAVLIEWRTPPKSQTTPPGDNCSKRSHARHRSVALSPAGLTCAADQLITHLDATAGSQFSVGVWLVLSARPQP